jgi:hypothetical protein
MSETPIRSEFDMIIGHITGTTIRATYVDGFPVLQHLDITGVIYGDDDRFTASVPIADIPIDWGSDR